MQHVEEAGRPLRRLGLRDPGDVARAGDARARSRRPRGELALRARRDRPDQHPVRRPRRRGALRDRGQPARLAHGAVRVEGDRRAAREDRLPADARASAWRDLDLPTIAGARRGHVSVKEAVLPFERFPRRRRAARPGDEVDRRGDGRRGRLPDRVRQGPGRRRRGAAHGRARSSSRSPTATSRPPPSSPPRFHDLGFDVVATGGTAQAIRRMGVPVERLMKISEGSPNVVDRIESGEVDLVINTPTGSGARSRRLRDPPRRGRARHPLHHDDDRAPARRSARSGRAAAGEPDGASRCRSCTAARRERVGRTAGVSTERAAHARALRPASRARRRRSSGSAPTG